MKLLQLVADIAFGVIVSTAIAALLYLPFAVAVDFKVFR